MLFSLCSNCLIMITQVCSPPSSLTSHLTVISIIEWPFLFTDISIAVVDLLQEMTDVDTLTESEEGANVLFDALVCACFIMELLISFHSVTRLVPQWLLLLIPVAGSDCGSPYSEHGTFGWNYKRRSRWCPQFSGFELLSLILWLIIWLWLL